MSPQILDGRALSQQVQSELAVRVDSMVSAGRAAPGLAVVLVGDNPASKVYVKSKTKNAETCGMRVIDVQLPADVGDKALQKKLTELSADEAVDGILLQLPLPKGMDEFAALLCISPAKDVDGLHPVNQGLLMRGADGHHMPCTPLGSMLLIDQAMKQLNRPADLSGLHAVVVGRSILVGKPVSMMLLSRNCTVEMCHSRTKNLADACRRADILVAAVGQAKLIKRDFVKPGAVVIDVGMNRDADGKLCGDVDFDSVGQVAAAITPVPKGVGPMTIAMLLSNTVASAERKAAR